MMGITIGLTKNEKGPLSRKMDCPGVPPSYFRLLAGLVVRTPDFPQKKGRPFETAL